jgi:hypothetical protein
LGRWPEVGGPRLEATMYSDTKYCLRCEKEIPVRGAANLWEYGLFYRDDTCYLCREKFRPLAEVSRPDGDGYCSDDQCPCQTSGARIPRGQGYLWITNHFADFRKDCLNAAQLERKAKRLRTRLNALDMSEAHIVAPLLLCEQGAQKRGLRMLVAANDARRWWKTGLVPLRPTPIAHPRPKSADDAIPFSGFNSVPILGTQSWEKWKEDHRNGTTTNAEAASARTSARSPSKRWWQFWK